MFEKERVEETSQPKSEEKPEKSVEDGKPSSKAIQTDIRVNLQKVDTVINLVGELMIVSQMITGNIEDNTDGNNRSSRQLNGLITELQDVAMSIRMIPLAGSFRKMVRLVRDLSKKSGKKVQFETRGEDTELDKTVVEQISDPLVHLVRNAIDHGLEGPEEREANGKSSTGKLVIEAKYEGNEVWINIIDDGKGLSREKILQKGIERGLVTEEDAKDWTDSKVFRLIFEPGFSTAAKVTSVSGRGVGMDVVKKNIEKVKGHVDIKSIPGQGSTIGLRIPLTLAIIDGMLLRVGDAVYTAPLLAIKESIQVNPDQVTMVGDREVVMIREQLIPVYRLHQLHDVEPQYTKLEEGILVVLEHQDEVFGLFVDELLGQYQTVIKGLSEYLGKVPGVAGCSILSNGEVSLILDVADLRKEIGL
jgi:two-component system, chemotaxis family, sensor kinase CheA